MDLANRKVALLGFGVENQALLSYLQSAGAVITICDQNEALPADQSGIEYRLGKEYLTNLTDFELIFRSPGIPYLNRQLQEARQAGVIISSQTKLFMERCPATVIGVTGTKGKGTTASLITAMLTAGQKNGELPGQVYLAGNIGTPMISLLANLTDKDWVVLELSSFQLEDLTVSPDIAVVLNVTVDHLDHHRDEAEYISAKKNIVRYQTPGDFLVVNLDSLTSLLFADETPAQTYFFSQQNSVDQGSFIDRQQGSEQIVWRGADQIDQIVCPVDQLKLIGPHNLENVTAAATAAKLAGAGMESIRSALVDFTGLPHRLQRVTEKAGISYYDDSDATTPDATIAAIQSFDRPITLIVGGSSKGADFSELVEQVTSSHVTTVICIGQEGERLHGLLTEAQATTQLIKGGGSMGEIVRQATEATQPGGVVLLSPGAASFDMFTNAADRGDQFQAAIRSQSTS